MFLTKKFFFLFSLGVLLFLHVLPTEAQSPQQPIVVLDPAHGHLSEDRRQFDPGASSGSLIEKDITLEVVNDASSFLKRCPVDVYLTRTGDDHDHTLSEIVQIGNSYKPTVVVAIHVNSSSGNPSGVESWYTDGGFDDMGSERLATLLTDEIAGFFSINRRVNIPDSAHPKFQRLYIRDFQAPSALVEIGYLQGDAELLRKRKNDFGRMIALSVLEFLNIPAECADKAATQGMVVGTYFPGETHTNSISLLNDGVVSWHPGVYELRNKSNLYGADNSYPLPKMIKAGGTVDWELPALAPSNPGIYQQAWQLYRGDETVSPEFSVSLIVVPEGMRELKENIDQEIQGLRQRGEEELKKYLAELEKKAVEWAKKELKNYLEDLMQKIGAWISDELNRQTSKCLGPNALIGAVIVGLVIWKRHR